MNKIKIFIAGLASVFVAVGIIFFVLGFIYSNSLYFVLTLVLFALLFDDLFAFYILNSKRYDNVKTSWIFVILLLPLIGVLLFLIFGINPLNKKDRKLYIKQQKDFLKYESFAYSKKELFNDDDSIFKYGLINSIRPICENNDIKIIEETPELYEKTIELIRSAKKFIHFQTYILHDGFWLRTIFAELIKKADEGVKIRLIYDWVGSFFRFNKKNIRELKRHGIDVGIFNPKGINMFKGATNFRSHRKVLIIDNKVALYGGSNIGDEYLTMNDHTNYWRDLNFIIKGEIVNSLNILFCSDWKNFTDYSLKKIQKNELMNNLSNILTPIKDKNKIKAQLIESSPEYEERQINNLLLSCIYRANRSINIVTPYFMPTSEIINGLIVASLRGVKVKIIVPGKNDDKDFILLVNRSKYQRLLKSGIEIFEYDGFIHSKYMIIDNKYVILGSYNLDFRSLYINFESALLIGSKSFSMSLNKIFENDLYSSRKINESYCKKLNTLKSKFALSFLNIYYPLF